MIYKQCSKYPSQLALKPYLFNELAWLVCRSMNSRNRFYNNHTIASIVSTRYLVVNELDATREDMKQVN